MNWKNRTYFQGGSARPFAQAADGSRATARSKPPKEGEKPRRPFRRFLGWLFLLTLVFGAGLTVGFMEDEKLEEVWSNIQTELYGSGNSGQSVNALAFRDEKLNIQWRHIWNTYTQMPTRHFKMRMICRKVSDEDVIQAGATAKLVDYEEKSPACYNDFEAKYTIVGETADGRSLTIIFSANNGTRKLNLITVWENGKDYDCPED